MAQYDTFKGVLAMAYICWKLLSFWQIPGVSMQTELAKRGYSLQQGAQRHSERCRLQEPHRFHVIGIANSSECTSSRGALTHVLFNRLQGI